MVWIGIRRWEGPLRALLAALLVVWAVVSLTGVSPLDRAPADERITLFLVLLPFGVGAYCFAAIRYLRLYRERGRILPLAVAVAFLLLAEALIAVAFGRAWHASWWEWHLLMAIAFGAIVIATRQEYRQERSFTEAFGGLYLEQTREHARSPAARGAGGAHPARSVGRGARCRDRPAPGRGVHRGGDRRARAGRPRALAGGRPAATLRRPSAGREDAERTRVRRAREARVEITALFADLAGFTSFSEDRNAADVVHMLDASWEAVVPAVVDDAGWRHRAVRGQRGKFVVLNALGDQPDHVARAARAAVAVQEHTEALRSGRLAWPRFRIGINTGTRGRRQRRRRRATIVRRSATPRTSPRASNRSPGPARS